METLEIARRLAQLGEREEAQRAYALVAGQSGGSDPEAGLEAALYLFHTGYDHRVPYTVFTRLYNDGYHKDELLDLISQAFYAPNLEALRRRYERNRKALSKYPYFFCKKDFPDFDALPLKFFPYDDSGYLPFDLGEDRFGDYLDPGEQIVSRSFFRDLEKPVFAADVYSQYELEYLNDNVRKSEWCAKENHIYLHYTDWERFCCWLQVLELQPLLREQKLVVLIEEEGALYPIDFKERYGIDYAKYPVKPFGVREIKKVIWHTQLSAHNGGDFFNEVLDGHPNLLNETSIFLNTMEDWVRQLRENLKTAGRDPKLQKQTATIHNLTFELVQELSRLRDLTDKDCLVAGYLAAEGRENSVDRGARIVPAVFFQPHFPVINFDIGVQGDMAALRSNASERLNRSPLLLGFKYIKTFTPLRRLTNSYAAANKFMQLMVDRGELVQNILPVFDQEMTNRMKNRALMADPRERVFKDSRVVRLEDAKLEPKATFAALAAFLDIPVTESMNECTGAVVKDGTGAPVAFDTSIVYKTYDEYASREERYLLEYFFRDLYEFYGYDLMYYDGAAMDEAGVDRLVDGMTWLRDMIEKGNYQAYTQNSQSMTVDGVKREGEEMKATVREYSRKHADAEMEEIRATAKQLLPARRYVAQDGQPLRFIPMVEPDRALCTHERYH